MNAKDSGRLSQVIITKRKIIERKETAR